MNIDPIRRVSDDDNSESSEEVDADNMFFAGGAIDDSDLESLAQMEESVSAFEEDLDAGFGNDHDFDPLMLGGGGVMEYEKDEGELWADYAIKAHTRDDMSASSRSSAYDLGQREYEEDPELVSLRVANEEVEESLRGFEDDLDEFMDDDENFVDPLAMSTVAKRDDGDEEENEDLWEGYAIKAKLRDDISERSASSRYSVGGLDDDDEDPEVVALRESAQQTASKIAELEEGLTGLEADKFEHTATGTAIPAIEAKLGSKSEEIAMRALNVDSESESEDSDILPAATRRVKRQNGKNGTVDIQNMIVDYLEEALGLIKPNVFVKIDNSAGEPTVRLMGANRERGAQRRKRLKELGLKERVTIRELRSAMVQSLKKQLKEHMAKGPPKSKLARVSVQKLKQLGMRISKLTARAFALLISSSVDKEKEFIEEELLLRKQKKAMKNHELFIAPTALDVHQSMKEELKKQSDETMAISKARIAAMVKNSSNAPVKRKKKAGTGKSMADMIRARAEQASSASQDSIEDDEQWKEQKVFVAPSAREVQNKLLEESKKSAAAAKQARAAPTAGTAARKQPSKIGKPRTSSKGGKSMSDVIRAKAEKRSQESEVKGDESWKNQQVFIAPSAADVQKSICDQKNGQRKTRKSAKILNSSAKEARQKATPTKRCDQSPSGRSEHSQESPESPKKTSGYMPAAMLGGRPERQPSRGVASSSASVSSKSSNAKPSTSGNSSVKLNQKNPLGDIPLVIIVNYASPDQGLHLDTKGATGPPQKIGRAPSSRSMGSKSSKKKIASTKKTDKLLVVPTEIRVDDSEREPDLF